MHAYVYPACVRDGCAFSFVLVRCVLTFPATRVAQEPGGHRELERTQRKGRRRSLISYIFRAAGGDGDILFVYSSIRQKKCDDNIRLGALP